MWRCVWTEERTDHDQASSEKAHSSLVRYPIFEFFRLNRSESAQVLQWKEKISILELRARETPEKVKMCLNWGKDRPRPGFTRKSSYLPRAVSDFRVFRLNRSAKVQGFQWKEKISILEFRARETPEKVKMCLNWGTDRPRPGFTRKSS
jgi:hypothetical protein